MILAALAIALSGAGLVAAGFPERAEGRVDRLLRAALAVALGFGTWSVAYAAARMGGWTQAGKDAALAAAGLALLFAARRRTAGLPAPIDPVPRWLLGMLALAVAIDAGAFAEHLWRFPDGGWDAWMVWNLRARFLYRAASLQTVFSPDLLFWAHADYPWLVPAAVAQGFALAGGETMRVPEIIALVFGILAAAIVPLACASLRGARVGGLAALAILTVPTFPIFVSNETADIPLAVFLGASAALILLAWERGLPPRMLALAGFAAGLGVWTKNEGALYAICLAAGLAFRTRNWRAVLAFCAGALPLAALLAVFKHGWAPPNDLAQFSTRATLLAHALDLGRWSDLALQSLRRIVFFQAFGLWLIAAVLYAALVGRKLPATPVGTAVLLMVLSWVPLYVLQPHPLHWVFRTSVDRLILQIWPAAVLAMLLPPARTTART